jgi:hypothetical protein
MVERFAACHAEFPRRIAPGAGAIEEVCLSNADAMSQIGKPLSWLYYAFRVRLP